MILPLKLRLPSWAWTGTVCPFRCSSRLLDSQGYSAAWLAVGLAGIGLIILAYLLSETDKKAFPLLYAEK